MRILTIFLLCFSLNAIPCEDREEPPLRIKLDSPKNSNGECSFYLVSVPVKYGALELSRVVLSIRNEMAVTLSTFIYEDERLRTGEICLNDKLFDDAKFSIEYKESVKPDGSISMCVQHYAYTNLSNFLVKD